MTIDAGMFVRIALLLTCGLIAAMLVRVPVRRLAGARIAYAIWTLPLAVMIANCLPAPRWPFDAAAPVRAISTPAVAMARQALPLIERTQTTHAAMQAASGPSMTLATLWAVGAIALATLLFIQQRRFVAGLGTLHVEHFGGGITVHVAATRHAGPAVVGVFRPKIVVSSDFSDRYSADEQRLVLAHEQLHVRRRDPFVNAVMAILRCVFWFNPIVHLAARLVRHDQELACDAATLAAGAALARSYAEAMLKTQFDATPLPIGCQWLSHGRHPITKRVALLRHRPSPFRQMLGATMIVAAIVVVSVTVSAVSVAPARPTTAVLDAHSLEARSVEVPHQTSADLWLRAIDGAAARLLGQPSIVEAARRGDVHAAADAVSRGADVNELMLGDGTPLIQAARGGHLEMVQQLLDRGADPNLAAPGDGNPLIMAAAGGHLAIVNLLLQRGADVNAYVPDDETALINAAARGYLAVVKTLVEQGANVNQAYDVRGARGTEHRSPLGQAERFGHDDVAAYLRTMGAAE